MHLDRWRWLDGQPPRAPYLGKVCAFATYAPDGHLSRPALAHAERWHEAGYTVFFAVITDDPDAPFERPSFGHVMLRENKGYDFGAWHTVLLHAHGMLNVDQLVIVNDSIYGPCDGFEDMLRRVDEMDADFIGAVESHQFRKHFQSFLIFFKRNAIQNMHFWMFWTELNVRSREDAIRMGELWMRRYLERHGLKSGVLFPLPKDKNPSIKHWRKLLAAGFPYIKRRVLTENHYEADNSDWRGVLAAKGFDVPMIERDLPAKPWPKLGWVGEPEYQKLLMAHIHT